MHDIKKIGKYVTNSVIALFFVTLLFVLALPVFHLQLMVVESGSMEPQIPYKSIILVQEIDHENVFDQIKVGDDVTVKTPGNLNLTHRVIALDEANQQIQTKGLANSVVDQPISVAQIIGKVVLVIPFIGYVLNLYIILILLAIWAFFYIVYLLYQELGKKKSL